MATNDLRLIRDLDAVSPAEPRATRPPEDLATELQALLKASKRRALGVNLLVEMAFSKTGAERAELLQRAIDRQRGMR